MNIGAKIQTIRLDAKADAGGGRDWTQAACAKRAGMSVSQWADIEQGRNCPRLDTLERIAAALGCTVAELVAV